MRTLFGIGARGDTIRAIQTALTTAGFDTGSADGVFGQATASAVVRFQAADSLTASGEIDDRTWQQLMNRPVPAASERSLQLTANFEGHGYGLAVGNFDGALLTWGIIGFTLASGEIQAIVRAINSNFPDKVVQAFGDDADELLQLINSDLQFQTSWANEHTVAGRALAQPWKGMFAAFGAMPEVQQEQLKHVQSDYLDPAIATAAKLGFTSELGLALCFDIHVQNGGIKAATMAQVLPQIQQLAEDDARKIVSNAVADSAKPEFQVDVRSRKLTIATGIGNVHGRNYVLEKWGLSAAFQADELKSTALGATGTQSVKETRGGA